MQAIEVKYLPPTNYRGSRWKAFCRAGSVTISYDYCFNSDDNACKAANLLIEKLGWNTEHYAKPVFGNIKNGNYVFVFPQF